MPDYKNVKYILDRTNWPDNRTFFWKIEFYETESNEGYAGDAIPLLSERIKHSLNVGDPYRFRMGEMISWAELDCIFVYSDKEKLVLELKYKDDLVNRAFSTPLLTNCSFKGCSKDGNGATIL